MDFLPRGKSLRYSRSLIVLRFILVFFCKSKLNGEYSDVFKDILKAIDKSRYDRNKDFIVQCVKYYIEKGSFTQSQIDAIKRVSNA